jgi:anti-sigma B factor antagonist
MSLAEEFGVHDHIEFTIRTTDDPDQTIVQPQGELDLATRDELYAALMAAFESGTPTVVLDLSTLDFMDSSGIKLINQAIGLAAERERGFFLVPGSRHIQRVFEVTGLIDRLPFAN